MNLIIDKEKAMWYSAIVESKCGVPFTHSWRKKPVKTPLELHEETCPTCIEIKKTGIIPPEIKMRKDQDRMRWMQEYARSHSHSIIEEKEIKRIYSELDPYGEENWYE